MGCRFCILLSVVIIYPLQALQRSLEKQLDSINRQISKIQEELKNMKDIDAQVSL